MALFNVAVAANVLGDAGNARRQRQALGRQASQQLVDASAVLGYQRALHAPLGGFAKDVQRTATQPFEPSQHAQSAAQPRAKLLFDQLAFVIALR